MNIEIITKEKEKEELIFLMKTNYDKECVYDLKEESYKKAIENFEKKYKKMISEEYKEDVKNRLQKTKNNTLVLGAMTKKENCKIFFYNSENIGLTYSFRYKVTSINKVELIIFVEKCEDVNERIKKILGQ